MAIKVVVEKYKPPLKPSGKPVKNNNKFYLPAIPWSWTLYSGSRVLRFGYCHTEEDANLMANRALKDFNH